MNFFQNIDPFNVNKNIKNKFFLNKIRSLTLHHYRNCNKYKKIIKNIKKRLDFPGSLGFRDFYYGGNHIVLLFFNNQI